MDFKVAGTGRCHHRAAARHQDRRHPRRRAGRRARSGEGSPHADPGEHERVHRSATCRGSNLGHHSFMFARICVRSHRRGQHVGGDAVDLGVELQRGDWLGHLAVHVAEDAFGDMDFKVAGPPTPSPRCSSTRRSTASPPTCWPPRSIRRRRPARRSSANMNECIAQPRAEVAATAPKIISITIPMDKIGEVIGPKGKVINTIQQETGADIAVDDDGSVGIVTIGRSRHRRWKRPRLGSCDRRPAEGRCRCDLQRQGGQRHQVRCVRQHPPRP